jgi:hypothetical protein
MQTSKFPFPAYIECCPYEPLLPDYTPQQQLQAVLGKDEVMNLMGLRNYYYMCNDLPGLLENLWVQEPENRASASLGSNYGFYIGWEEIQRFVAETWSQLEIGAASQSVNTPLIYVAFDGKTARGLWYCDGYLCDQRGNTDVLYQKVAADFIREGDQWKIWHLVFGTDIVDPLHTDPLPKDFGILGDTKRWFGTPTVACTTHDPKYNWNDDYPAEPAAYETFRLSESYAPEGCPRYRQHMREVRKHEKI